MRTDQLLARSALIGWLPLFLLWLGSIPAVAGVIRVAGSSAWPVLGFGGSRQRTGLRSGRFAAVGGLGAVRSTGSALSRELRCGGPTPVRLAFGAATHSRRARRPVQPKDIHRSGKLA